MRYPAKKDFGTACAFLLFISMVVGFGIFAIVIEGPGGGAAAVVVGVFAVLTALLWVWFWFGTSYEITASEVIIRLGPLKQRIGIEEIVEAVPTSSTWLMVGGLHIRCALSRDAIMIKSSKKLWPLVFLPYKALISPQDKTGFLQALAEASPNLEQSDDGSVRRRPEVAG